MKTKGSTVIKSIWQFLLGLFSKYNGHASTSKQVIANYPDKGHAQPHQTWKAPVGFCELFKDDLVSLCCFCMQFLGMFKFKQTVHSSKKNICDQCSHSTIANTCWETTCKLLSKTGKQNPSSTKVWQRTAPEKHMIAKQVKETHTRHPAESNWSTVLILQILQCWHSKATS